MAHPISIAEQAMKLFVMQWFNGLKPSLYLSTKSDGSIVMTSEVASFSASLQVPPNVSHSGRRTGVYILQMTCILFPRRTDPAPKILAIEGNQTPPN